MICLFMISMLTRTNKHLYYLKKNIWRIDLIIMSSATYLLSDKNETMYVLE